MKKNVLSVFTLLLGLTMLLSSCGFDEMEDEGLLSDVLSKEVEAKSAYLKQLEEKGLYCITGRFDDFFRPEKVEELKNSVEHLPAVTMAEMLSVIDKFGVEEWLPFDYLKVSDHSIDFDRENFRWTAGLEFTEGVSLCLSFDVIKHIPDITNHWFELSIGDWRVSMPMVFFKDGYKRYSHSVYDIDYWRFDHNAYIFFKVLKNNSDIDYYFAEVCFQGRLNPDDVEGEFYHRLRNDSFKDYKFNKQ